MNKGCKIATGNWIYFLGAGDILLNILAKLVVHFSDQSTVYYGDVYKLDELKIYNGRFSAFKLAVQNICHQAVFYPAKIFKYLSYNLKYSIQADYDLNIRCYGLPDIRFQYIPIIICAYEGDGLSAKKIDFAFFNDKPTIINSNFPALVYNYLLIRNYFGKMINKNHWTKLRDQV